LLPSGFVKFVGVCLLIIGVYDTNVYRYALARGGGSFDFFGKELPGKHRMVRLGFTIVLVFYYVAGSILVLLG
jgi:hypothetical protein